MRPITPRWTNVVDLPEIGEIWERTEKGGQYRDWRCNNYAWSKVVISGFKNNVYSVPHVYFITLAGDKDDLGHASFVHYYRRVL